MRQLPEHKLACQFHPRPCPNGCGAQVRIGDMTAKHLRTCPLGTATCGAADTEDDSETCPALVRRVERPRHRQHECVYARLSRCRHCRKEVSLRSVAAHQQLCSAVREPCPRGCGTLVAKDKLEEHLARFCSKEAVPCPFAPFGCSETLQRAHVGTHLQHSTTKHLKLFAEVLLKVKGEAEQTNRNLEAQRSITAATLARQKDQVLEELAEVERRLQKDMQRMRDDNAELRRRVDGELTVLRAAMDDQAKTYSAKLLEMFEEFKVLRKEFEEFRDEQEATLKALGERVDREVASCGERVEATRREVARIVADQHDAITTGLADVAEERLKLVKAEAQRLQNDVDDHRWASNAKMRNLWEHVQSIGKGYI